MSFAADNIKAKTGRSPDDLVALAKRKNLTEPKAILDWLTADYGLEPEDARAVARAILAGPAPGGRSDDPGRARVGGRRKSGS